MSIYSFSLNLIIYHLTSYSTSIINTIFLYLIIHLTKINNKHVNNVNSINDFFIIVSFTYNYLIWRPLLLISFRTTHITIKFAS